MSEIYQKVEIAQNNTILKLQAELETANKKLAKTEKVIEFYGDKEGWIPRQLGNPHIFNKVDTEDLPYHSVKMPDKKTRGGKTAREYFNNKEREG